MADAIPYLLSPPAPWTPANTPPMLPPMSIPAPVADADDPRISPLVNNPRTLATMALMRANNEAIQARTPAPTLAVPRPLPPEVQTYLDSIAPPPTLPGMGMSSGGLPGLPPITLPPQPPLGSQDHHDALVSKLDMRVNQDQAQRQAAAVLPALVNPFTSQQQNPFISQQQQNSGQQAVDGQARLQYLNKSGSGVSQILHPVDANGNPTGQHIGFLRRIGGIAANIGDVLESSLLPGAAAFTPGSTLNHLRQVNEQTSSVDGQLANQQQEANTALLDAQPQLKQSALDLQTAKLDANTQHQQDVLDQQKLHQADTYAANLRQHGYAPDETDPTGKALRPLRYEEMAPQQQALVDLRGSQAEEADAQAALKRASNDPTSPAYRQAQARIATAQRNAQTAADRLSLSTQQFEMRSRGTDAQGNALPGAMIGDDGKPIGTAFQQNVRPTGAQRTKGNLADSAAEQLSDLTGIIQRNRQMFGPGYGQSTAFKQWIGAQSPDAQRFVTARTIAGDHMAGVFGGRSEAALDALDNAIGHFKDNPDAALAGISQLTKANARFQQAGTVHTQGSNAERNAPNGGQQPRGYVSLSDAMALPANKGKSQAAVTQDLRAHGYEVR